jgi:hypothetical protein
MLLPGEARYVWEVAGKGSGDDGCLADIRKLQMAASRFRLAVVTPVL